MIKIITLFASGLLGLEDEKPDCFAQQNSKKKVRTELSNRKTFG